MMRIVLLIRDLDLGGAQRQAVQLAVGLARVGDRVTVALWRAGGALEAELCAAGIEIAHLHPGMRGDLLHLARRLRGLLKRGHTQVVYALMPVENVMATLACAGTGVPVVWGIRTSRQAVSRMRLSQRALFLAQALAAWLPQATISNSRAGLSLAGPLARRKRLYVVPNSVDTRHFRPNTVDRSAARLGLGVDLHATVIAVVGRVEPQKGIEVFVEAMAKLGARDREIIALLVGRAQMAYAEALRQRIHLLGLGQTLRMLPQQPDIRMVYAATDIVVSPSIGEGMSNVIAEALACGKRVVASRVGDAEQVVGDCGWLVAPGDSDGLRAGLEAALASADSSLEQRAHARMTQMFSIDALVQSTRAILAGVACARAQR